MTRLMLSMAILLCMAVAAFAEIKGEDIEYREGEMVMSGTVFYDTAAAKPRPGVLVYHAWMGPGEHEKKHARMLAEMGYVAFVADIYGKGIRPKDVKEASALATKYKTDRGMLRVRAHAAFESFSKMPIVDASRISAIGYCFGGTTALELARSGAKLKAVVTFHGGLDSPKPEDGKNIKAKLLILHGADDPYVPAQDITKFQDELRKAGVDWQMVYYSGAVHSFTDPAAGNDNSKGAAYNESAYKRSWRAMKDFLGEVSPAK